jgi:hypothetical protein
LTKELHIAAQYIAAAGISFLEKQADDSHTNLGWDVKSSSVTGQFLKEDGLHMALSYLDFSIEFRRKDRVLAKIPLSSSRHGDIIKWLEEVFRDLLFKSPYRYDLHYSLPYQDLNIDYVFPNHDQNILNELAALRSIAFTVLSEHSSEHNEPTSVRIWPHHFDTGSLLWLSDMDSIGLGLATPDEMVDQYYFYASGWSGHEMMDTSKFQSLKKGNWMNDQWKGAVLPAMGKNIDEVRSFFTEVMSTYMIYAEKVA